MTPTSRTRRAVLVDQAARLEEDASRQRENARLLMIWGKPKAASFARKKAEEMERQRDALLAEAGAMLIDEIEEAPTTPQGVDGGGGEEGGL